MWEQRRTKKTKYFRCKRVSIKNCRVDSLLNITTITNKFQIIKNTHLIYSCFTFIEGFPGLSTNFCYFNSVCILLIFPIKKKKISYHYNMDVFLLFILDRANQLFLGTFSFYELFQSYFKMSYKRALIIRSLPYQKYLIMNRTNLRFKILLR